jgi:hypothetical protein
MSKNYKVSDLILFLTFLQEEIKTKNIYFIHCAKDPVKNYIEFMVLDGAKKKNNCHTLRIFDDDMDNTSYFPPSYARNRRIAQQITRFSKWLKREG